MNSGQQWKEETEEPGGVCRCLCVQKLNKQQEERGNLFAKSTNTWRKSESNFSGNAEEEV